MVMVVTVDGDCCGAGVLVAFSIDAQLADMAHGCGGNVHR